MKQYFTTKTGRLRLFALLEGLSFILLVAVAVPFKYLLGDPRLSGIMGMVHGLLFVLYIFNFIQCKVELSWPLKKTLFAIAASFIPFAPFYVMAKMIPSMKNETSPHA